MFHIHTMHGTHGKELKKKTQLIYFPRSLSLFFILIIYSFLNNIFFFQINKHYNNIKRSFKKIKLLKLMLLKN